MPKITATIKETKRIPDVDKRLSILQIRAYIRCGNYAFSRTFHYKIRAGEPDLENLKAKIKEEALLEYETRQRIKPIEDLKEKRMIIDDGKNN
jgi:hypothetical protein